MNTKPAQKNSKLWTVILILMVGSLAGNLLLAMGYFTSRMGTQSGSVVTLANEPSITTITALGTLEPQGDIIQIAAPDQYQQLKKWLVKEGDRIQAGQTIAIMYGIEQAQAAVNSALTQVETAQARLAQVKAGEAPGRIEAQRRQVAQLQAQLDGDIKVQQTVIARHQSELDRAEADYQRFYSLLEEGGVSASEVEDKRLAQEIAQEQLREAQATLQRNMATNQEQIQEAQATLASLSQIRPSDIRVAEAEVSDALSLLQQVEIDLKALSVHAPIDGQLLSINTNVGERVGSQGLATIGQTQQMYVTAEVYESDVRYVQVGQTATIVSEFGGFIGELYGKVEQIGLQIDKPSILNNNPAAQSDVRIVKVRIRLDPEDSEQVKTLNQLQVRVSIEI